MEIELAQSNHVKERSQTKMSSMGEESQVVLHHRPLVALIHSAQFAVSGGVAVHCTLLSLLSLLLMSLLPD